MNRRVERALADGRVRARMTTSCSSEPAIEVCADAGRLVAAVRIVTASLADADRASRLARALLDRERIAHAQGVLMERDGVSAVEAASRLFDDARHAELTLSEHAATVVTSTRRGPR